MRKTKIHSVLLFLLALVPLFLMCAFVFKIHIGDTETNIDLSSAIDNAIQYSSTCLDGFVSSLPWFASFKTFLISNGFLGTSAFSSFIYSYFNYLILLLLLDLMFYSFSFFLVLIRSFVSKFGGDF